MKNITKQVLGGERVNYQLREAAVTQSVYLEGESAFKECEQLKIAGCDFYGRYPLWHGRDIALADCRFHNDTRAAFWYDENIAFESVVSEGIKPLRESRRISISHSSFSGDEMLWRCRDIAISDVRADSAYLLFECSNAAVTRLFMRGKYSFQYAVDIAVTDSDLDTKDAFWHSRNCTIKNSRVKGEYVGWYAQNLTLINCVISGTQPFCYCENLRLIDCTFESGDRAFKRSTVEASFGGKLESIYNPRQAVIRYRGVRPAVEIDDPEAYRLELVADTVDH